MHMLLLSNCTVTIDRSDAAQYLLSLDQPAFAGVESSDGQKALTSMIVKMPEVVCLDVSNTNCYVCEKSVH